MTAPVSHLAELLADCDAYGVRLLPAGDRLIIDAPQEALAPVFLGRLKACKAELLELLQLTVDTAEANSLVPDAPTEPICRCGSTSWREVSIHGGQSVRLDCKQCQRFIEFSVWYGTHAGHIGQ